ncbi:MAG: hypothetical protein KAS90_06070, partial [Candidatus Aenigmarchaeota archaeon]|nr:hypothetical protein [Candidatus Aenigmarchaeota archaeon]
MKLSIGTVFHRGEILSAFIYIGCPITLSTAPEKTASRNGRLNCGHSTKKRKGIRNGIAKKG